MLIAHLQTSQYSQSVVHYPFFTGGVVEHSSVTTFDYFLLQYNSKCKMLTSDNQISALRKFKNLREQSPVAVRGQNVNYCVENKAF